MYAEILFSQNDPKLAELLEPLVHHNESSVREDAIVYLALLAKEKYRPFFKKNIKGWDLSMFAWAGLANLGDKGAMVKVAEYLSLGKNNYRLRQMFSRMDTKAIVKAWEDQLPKKGDRIQSAINAFISAEIKQLQAKVELQEKKRIREKKNPPSLVDFIKADTGKLYYIYFEH